MRARIGRAPRTVVGCYFRFCRTPGLEGGVHPNMFCFESINIVEIKRPAVLACSVCGRRSRIQKRALSTVTGTPHRDMDREPCVEETY